jgi:hypothetical protein
MLKLTYTEDGLHMERVVGRLETLVAQRVVLALRLGQKLHIEPGRAAFLLSAEASELVLLETALHMERSQCITIAPVDDEFVEVSIYGNWMAENANAHEGMFITALSDHTEFFVHKLWLASQMRVSSLA